MAAEHNTIYISIDGVSRNTFYQLLHKNKLPGIQKIIDRGNYRNLDISNHPSERLLCYTELFSGYCNEFITTQDTKTSVFLPGIVTVFERLKEHIPSLNTGIIVSSINNSDKGSLLKILLEEISTQSITVYPETSRSAKTVAALASDFIINNQDPFFLFFNFTDVEHMGHKYREGAEVYSQALIECDKALKKVINTLYKSNRWNNTEFFITTNYGFSKKSKNHKLVKKSWIASTMKIRYKGYQSWIVPTIYTSYRINWKSFQPKLKGSSLIYY
ncbi:MAG: alkaline phosphatase family protein [bacterium]|nr:alkaline phosphatase family protein [bacterium]